jgi:hypothetical protein
VRADFPEFDLGFDFSAIELAVNLRPTQGELFVRLLADFVGGDSGLAFGDLQ